MKQKMLTLLCTVFIINLPGVVLASADSEVETKDSYEVRQANDLNFNTFDTLNDAKQRSYYFYDMISDYFEVQDFLRGVYGDAFMNDSYQYRYLTLAKKYFDKYYETNDINDLDFGITYLYDHHASVGAQNSYHVNYRITSNSKREYVPSNFNKDKTDIADFMIYVMNIA